MTVQTQFQRVQNSCTLHLTPICSGSDPLFHVPLHQVYRICYCRSHKLEVYYNVNTLPGTWAYSENNKWNRNKRAVNTSPSSISFIVTWLVCYNKRTNVVSCYVRSAAYSQLYVGEVFTYNVNKQQGATLFAPAGSYKDTIHICDWLNRKAKKDKKNPLVRASCTLQFEFKFLARVGVWGHCQHLSQWWPICEPPLVTITQSSARVN